jgi:hypothetical protein
MKVLLDKNNVVVAKAEDIKETEFGFYIKEIDTYYAPHGLKLVETKLNPRVRQDKLENGVVKANPDYKTPEEMARFRKDAELKRLLVEKVITKEEYDKIAK